MRIVADTNVVVSGLLWSGPPASILDHAAIGTLRAFSSEDLLTELLDTLRHPKLGPRLEQRGWTADEVFAKYRSMARLVTPGTISHPTALRDPKDLPVLACGVAAEAGAIVTGDRDLLTIEEFAGIPIVTPRELLLSLGL